MHKCTNAHLSISMELPLIAKAMFCGLDGPAKCRLDRLGVVADAHKRNCRTAYIFKYYVADDFNSFLFGAHDFAREIRSK